MRGSGDAYGNKDFVSFTLGLPVPIISIDVYSSVLLPSSIIDITNIYISVTERGLKVKESSMASLKPAGYKRLVSLLFSFEAIE